MRILTILLSFFLLFSEGIAAKKARTKRKAKPVVIVDPGHGGLDLGARVRGPYVEEKKLALQTALLLKSHLQKKGYKVVMTRQSDVFLPLARRITSANPKRASIFVSLHYNSSSNKQAHGIEIFYHNHKKYKKRASYSKKLATRVLDKLIGATSARSRGVKKGNFFVIRKSKIPSILVEGGFLTNQGERKKLRQKSYIDLLARSIAEGIDQYFKQEKYVLGAT